LGCWKHFINYHLPEPLFFATLASEALYRLASPYPHARMCSYTCFMLIYLDLCCFNRPWDDQSTSRVRIETEAKLVLQDRIKSGLTGLAWSYVLSYENELNPHRERRESIALWERLAKTTIGASSKVVRIAEEIAVDGATSFDALHVACAVDAGAALFVTTDDRLLRIVRRRGDITAQLPQEALATLEQWYEN
jgi:predicted nucleic acid-binding protein